MSDKALPVPVLPLSQEQLERLKTATSGLTPVQLAWVSGYLWGLTDRDSNTLTAAIPSSTSAATARPVTILSASQTGNARRLATQLRDDLSHAGLSATLVNAGEYKFKQIDQERQLIVVASTQGEGDAPEEAIALYKYLFSKKAPALSQTQFAVFGLGDTSYENFCQTGKDFDRRLEELGAKRLLARVDADVDYQSLAEQWRHQIVERLKAEVPASLPSSAVHTQGISQNHSKYTKQQPLIASLSVNQKITSRSSDRDVRHIEIDLGDSGLSYQPGDALGVWFQNDAELIEVLLSELSIDGDTQVEVQGKPQPLKDALKYHYELTQNTTTIVEFYANYSGDSRLVELLTNKTRLQEYAHNTPIVDMVRHAPSSMDAQTLLTMLRPITPRLYSIASSQEEVGSEAHLTVGVVRYNVDGNARTGGASGYLADRLEEEGDIAVFIEHNDNFRLPDDPSTPVVMIGPGTGIAPFRAFMQQREAIGAEGKNWLFFGNPHFTSDFLYQVEWQRYVKSGLLNRIDLAWSRDQQHKVYVQDKLRENGSELWQWIQDGAHLYVCGDANRMAKDVERALLDVVSTHGAMDPAQADEFLSELRIDKRYQRDVY
ncbi:NADPH-dependent assimilatory sulfite reductase flavoprotein subunit [Budviciaceae bacterium CWB-B4]|uniref:Sulfite reductase [NADPH] flavoprotein alpha-component n=1 Tax=Limnobaculum xujianqingii TaxID=2738837 RepID=A0A9D7FRV6_9GAMM|nr:NADPH-dependent assimilatory sulfite reductase flavoprotein subunit [Limnobaculum xujianqingii]MBK5072330.1 NADPH-dependent assimilatory sulfite reductase flavoprotein subunit [Limnobaculum xujianqingii]MBK5175639.1 NADPH-dependent assimilatory sulfite reductase flavoprotein subunit [Limnobaculum xujianqingii]